MRVYNLGGDDLSEWELDKLREIGATDVWYVYDNGGYDGSGNVLFFDDKGWAFDSLSHCSCDGPLDSISDVRYESLDAVRKACSDQYYNSEMLRLVDAARLVAARVMAAAAPVKTRRILF